MYLVGNPRPTNPEGKMTAVAAKRGWPVLRFTSRSGANPLSQLRTLAGAASIAPFEVGAVGVGLLAGSRRRTKSGRFKKKKADPMARRRPARRSRSGKPPRSAGRVYVRDSRGRFAPAPGASPVSQKRKRRRRTAVAGSTVVAGVVVAGQARNPASRTRTAVQRRRIVARHVARAQADHERLASVRASVFPTTVVTGQRFDSAARKAARAEARRLTAGYRQQAERVRRSGVGDVLQRPGETPGLPFERYREP